MTFGEWVKKQRESRGLGPAECARRAGLSPQRWSNIEAKSKRPYPETCEEVSKALEMPLEEVMAAAGLASGDTRSSFDHRLEEILHALTPEIRARVKESLLKDAAQYVDLLLPLPNEESNPE